MAKDYGKEEPLARKALKSFSKGFNAYTSSKTAIDDEEFPEGLNVVLDDNGSAAKRAGSRRFGGPIGSGSPILGAIQAGTKVLAAAGDSWYLHDESSTDALSGATFAGGATYFAEVYGRIYGANGTDPLSWTDDGTAITQVTSNGLVGTHPVNYNQRLYMLSTDFPERVYYSNPITIDYEADPPAFSLVNVGTFDTDLSPVDTIDKKNAGYVIIAPGKGIDGQDGVRCTDLYKDSEGGQEYLYVTTLRHGIHRIAFSSLDSNGAVVHDVKALNRTAGSPSGRSMVKVLNDLEWYDGDNYYSRGLVAQYQDLRLSTKTARIQTELAKVPDSLRYLVSSGYYKEKLYVSYPLSETEYRVEVRDTRLNAWSSPWTGISPAFFLPFDDGTNKRLLIGSADPAEPYLIELETGLDDNGSAVEAFFTTKSTDCGQAGLVKRFAFADVFYTAVFGVLQYEVFLDETRSLTGTLQLGTSATATAGVGSRLVGSFLVGGEFNDGEAATAAFSGKFRIPCRFKPGQRVSVRFTNGNVSEQFKIEQVVFYYQAGNIYETGSTDVSASVQNAGGYDNAVYS